MACSKYLILTLSASPLLFCLFISFLSCTYNYSVIQVGGLSDNSAHPIFKLLTKEQELTTMAKTMRAVGRRFEFSSFSGSSDFHVRRSGGKGRCGRSFHQQ
jgi:hypothetical protein